MARVTSRPRKHEHRSTEQAIVTKPPIVPLNSTSLETMRQAGYRETQQSTWTDNAPPPAPPIFLCVSDGYNGHAPQTDAHLAMLNKAR
jgi:hypothetical protein